MTYYMIYDARYIANPSKSMCFEICDTLKEALDNKSEYGDGCVVVEAEIVNNEIVSQKII